MKTKFAVVALFVGLFMQSAFAAEFGISLVMLNNIPAPSKGDRMVFKALDGDQCRYIGRVQQSGAVDIQHKICGDLISKYSMTVPLHEDVTETSSGTRIYKGYENSPEALAITFMTQFYEVPAEAVTVEVIEREKLAATVKATAAGHTCTMGMAPAPSGVVAKHGWLSSSMKCGS